MSTTTLAAVMVAPHQPIEIRELERPDLPPGSALLPTARSEVCGTDVHLWHGCLSGVRYPIVPGHVSAGILEMRGCRGSEARHLLRALGLLDQHARTVPWRTIGARPYPLTGLNEALADAEQMVMAKALVDPWAGV